MRTATRKGKLLTLPPGFVTTPTAARIAGLPASRLRKWIARGALRPINTTSRGRGALWAWDLRAVVAARAIAELSRAHVSPQRIRRAVAAIEKSGLDLASVKLLAIGADVFRVVAPAELLSLVERPGQHAFALFDLATWTHKVRDRAGALGVQLSERGAA